MFNRHLFQFDDLSHKSSGSSLNQPVVATALNTNKHDIKQDVNDEAGETLRRYTEGSLPPLKPPRVDVKIDEWDLKLYGKQPKSMHCFFL